MNELMIPASLSACKFARIWVFIGLASLVDILYWAAMAATICERAVPKVEFIPSSDAAIMRSMNGFARVPG